MTDFVCSTAAVRGVTFRVVFILAVGISIIYNAGILTALVVHFGGGMNYTLIEAHREMFRQYHGREATRHEVFYAQRGEHKDQLLIDWHDDHLDQYLLMQTHLHKNDIAFFMTQNRHSGMLNQLQQDGHAVKLIRTFNFLDAPPFFFKVYKFFKTVSGTAQKRQTYLFQIDW